MRRSRRHRARCSTAQRLTAASVSLTALFAGASLAANSRMTVGGGRPASHPVHADGAAGEGRDAGVPAGGPSPPAGAAPDNNAELAARAVQAADRPGGGEKIHVWVWWDFEDGVPTPYRLNVRTWLRHMPADTFELHLISPKSIREWIPDLQKEYNLLYMQAKSDFVRAAMLALYGGVYMDADMLIREDVSVIFRDVFQGDVEAMPYLFDIQKCRKSFSTNFMAAKKNNRLSRGWYQRVLQKLGSRCPYDAPNRSDRRFLINPEVACCYAPNGKARAFCFVDFGAIGDASAHRTMKDLDASDANTSSEPFRMECISKDLGMAEKRAGSGGELLWLRLVPGPPEGFNLSRILPWGKVAQIDKKTEVCWRGAGTDLVCSQSGLYPAFFGRHGFHLFNSINSDVMWGFETEEELLASGSVAAELYRLALAGERGPDPRFAALGLKRAKVKLRAADARWGNLNLTKMPWLKG